MLPELSELKRKRQAFDLTQIELAQKTGVSQSLIAKTEAGRIIPGYANAKKLFDFFESLHHESELRAHQLMAHKVLSARPDSTLKDATRAMEKNAVSQLPVIEEGKNIGTISEKLVLDKMNEVNDPTKAGKLIVRDVMGEAMPVIMGYSSFRAVSALLENNAGVLVARKGKIVGIITKSDLLNSMLKRK